MTHNLPGLFEFLSSIREGDTKISCADYNFLRGELSLVKLICRLYGYRAYVLISRDMYKINLEKERDGK